MNKLMISFYYLRDIARNVFSRDDVVLISETATWAIYEDCVAIRAHLKDRVAIRIAFTPIGLRNTVVHFASAGTFIRGNRVRKVHRSNSVILTWFHLTDASDPRLALMKSINERVAYVHTSCSITEAQLLAHGLDARKIIRIPIGVDTAVFSPAQHGEKVSVRAALGIPAGAFVVGSFQKDGDGWGEGESPKLIKGPDIFCDVVERVTKQYPLMVLLTGPARGYVKRRLTKAGIMWFHAQVDTPSGVAPYYRALDAYLITSRVEGGPKALGEAAASGVALVTTRVGMVPDIMNDGEDCLIAAVEDKDALARHLGELAADAGMRERLAAKARETIARFDIRNTATQYYDTMYRTLLS